MPLHTSHITTDTEPPGSRPDLVRHLTDTTRARADQRFRGPITLDARTATTPDYQLVYWDQHSGIHILDRGPTQARRDPADDYYTWHVPTGGAPTQVRIGDDVGSTTPGLSYFMPAGTQLQAATPPSRTLLLKIRRDLIEERLGTTAPSDGQIQVTAGPGLVAVRAALDLVRAAPTMPEARFDATAAAITDLVTGLLAGDGQPTSPALLGRSVEAIREYVARHLSAPLTVEDAARGMHWTPGGLRATLAATGTSWRPFLHDVRMEEARSLLEDPARRDLSIGQVARLCGYESESTFGARFRRHHGMTPRECRARAAAVAYVRSGGAGLFVPIRAVRPSSLSPGVDALQDQGGEHRYERRQHPHHRDHRHRGGMAA